MLGIETIWQNSNVKQLLKLMKNGIIVLILNRE